MRRYAVLALLLLSGCGNSVVFVPDGVAVRLAEDVQAKVFTPDGKGGWVKSSNRMTLKSGGYYKTLHLPATQPTRQREREQ